MSAVVLRGDARNIPLADASVDLIVTSPPYFGLRSYTDGGEHYGGQIGAEQTPAEYVAALLECTAEWMRVLKPEGSIFVNLGDKYDGDKSLMYLPERYRIACRDDLGLTGRAVIIWSKPNGMPSSATDRVRNSHEDWVHLAKQPRYFTAVDEIRERTEGRAGQMTWEQRKARGDAMRQGEQRGTFGGGMAENPLGKLPGSVWAIATQPLKVPDHIAHATCCGGMKRDGCEDGLRHDAAFPTEWPRRLVLGWSPPRGIVLDPLGGSGTTALVADTLGRHAISVDLSADYCRLAAWRTTDPGERARALGVPKPPPVIDGQGDLFGEGAA